MSNDQVKDSVREEFKKLSLDGKTAFLVEAIFSTAGSAINEIGGRLTSLVSLVTDPFEEQEAEDEAPSEDTGKSAGKSGSSASKKGSTGAGTGKGRSTKK